MKIALPKKPKLKKPKREQGNVVEMPATRYFSDIEAFSEAVGKDFIAAANKMLSRGDLFFVGLSHGRSPAGAYAYILENYDELIHPENMRYTFVNSPSQRQKSVNDVLDARAFVKKLFRAGQIVKEQVIGHDFNSQSISEYAVLFNKQVQDFLTENKKTGLDYAFLATTPTGMVAAIDRDAAIFESKKLRSW